MNGNLRIWAPASVLAALAIAAGGFMLGVQPALAAASADDDAAAAAVTQQGVVEAKLTRLAAAAAHQSELDAQNAVLNRAVPSAMKANTFIDRMNDLAELDGITISAVTPGVGAAYAPTAAAAATSGAASSAVFGATDPSITAKNFTLIPMTLTATGGRDALLTFTRDAQKDQRLFLISTYALAPASDDATAWSVTLTGSIYAVQR